MKTGDLKGKKITVMGLGLHGGGVGTVRFLFNAGAQVTVTDLKSKEELGASLEKLKDLKNIEYVFNQHRPEDFKNTDMVVKNPSAPWNNKYIRIALENKIPVEIDSSLFFKLCSNPIIGVTGTKGKTTTSTLIYEILKTAGKNVIKVGIGQTSVLDKLQDLKKDTIVVFELSSWRLSALGRYKLSPETAVITNLYPDHLNYYRSMEEYVDDKKYIFLHQKENNKCIINWDNDLVKKIKEEIKSEIIGFSKEEVEMDNLDKFIYLKEGAIYVRRDEKEEKILEISSLKTRGEHILADIMAAIGATYFNGIKISFIQKSLVNFKGLEHRLELVRELAGVKYYNDTAATTPESAVSGIRSFSEPIILICGGSDKSLDMTILAEEIMSKLKGVIFLKGAATDKLISAIKKVKIDMEEEKLFQVVETMEKAVELARGEAKDGEVVLLSPGAASFGLFKNEFDRGDKFKEVVKKLS